MNSVCRLLLAFGLASVVEATSLFAQQDPAQTVHSARTVLLALYHPRLLWCARSSSKT